MTLSYQAALLRQVTFWRQNCFYFPVLCEKRTSCKGNRRYG